MSWPGFHLVPVRNLNTPTSPMAGTPFANMNTHMSTTARIEMQAQSRNTTFMALSLKLIIFSSHAERA